MMLDARLSDRDKIILTRLSFHLHFKTGDLYPSLHILALELSLGENEDSTKRVVRRSLARAEKLGWIERHARHGGYRLNRSNLYRLTLPVQITKMLAEREDNSSKPRGQIQQTERTPASPITSASRTRVANEHSDLSDRHRPLARTGAPKAQSIDVKEGATEEGAYSEDTLSLCEHFFHNFATRPRSFGAIRSFCQQNGDDITFGELTALVNAGKVKQSRDGYWMDEPEE